MQSNHDFGVAATLSVNAHGWPVPYGPFGTTVRSFRLMLASGELVTCSPTENRELFALAMGGYGLFGVIVDLEAAMVENVRLRPTYELMPAAQLGPRMVARVTQDPSVRMAYGRLAVDTQRFLREALLVTLRPVAGRPPAATSGGLMVSLSREVFRAQIGSDKAKRARWYAETVAGPKTSSGIASRNRLLNEPVANLAGRDRARTDILHEYFLPAEGLEPFLVAGRTHHCRLAPGSLERDATLRRGGPDQRAGLRAGAPGGRRAAVLAADDPGRRRGHGGDDRAPHRRGPRRGRRLLPALPSARAARPGRAGLLRGSRSSWPASVTTIPACCSSTRCGAGTWRREPTPHPRGRLRRAVRGRDEPQLHPRAHRRPGPDLRPLRPRRLRRRAARGVGTVGRAGGLAIDRRHPRLLPRLRDALLPRRAARPRHRLRIPRPRHRPARRARSAAHHAHPDEPAAHRDRRLRGLRGIRAGPASGPPPPTPGADMRRGRSGSPSGCSSAP